jgi:acyl-CoA synthetase (AMP-forming)/AMP-acid ligase II
VNKCATGIELLDRVARWETDRGDQIAYLGASGSGESADVLTWSALAQRVRTLAAELDKKVPAGATVLVSLENGLEFPIAFLGVLASGRSVFPVNPELAPPEQASAIKRSAAAAVIGRGLKIEATAPFSPSPCTQGEGGGGGSSLSVPSANLTPTLTLPLGTGRGDKSGPSLLLTSTGTTGRPKIVMRTAASVDAVSGSMVEAVDFVPEDRVLATVPLCHSYGLEHGLLAPVWAGSQVHLCRGLDMAVLVERIGRGEITIWPGVPAMFEMVANIGTARAPGLKVAYSAGGAFPRSLFDQLDGRMGIRVGQIYGATEIGSVAFADPRDASFDPASVGKPMRGVEIRLMPTSGADDQIAVRATSMMREYIGEETPMTPDGFFPTGDLGHVDSAGNIHLTGRLKLLIDVGGLKVSPMEVEAALREHESVGECIVVPLPLSATVNRLRAIVTPRDGQTAIDVDELREFARKRLSPHKVPRVIEVRADLPRSPTGKILRQEAAGM